MFELILPISLVLLRTLHCSLVIDSLSQKGIYISDFCPKTEHCAEGTHVMCMYYDPNRVMGPRCNKPKNVSITPALAEKLLEVSNAIRGKIALGMEKGKGGDLLPRGYGLYRLKWDSELATFAQVLANQCVLRHDMCRATKRFSDPGQTAGLVRFSYPEWFPVSNGAQFTKPGLTVSKLAYAITQTLKSWYNQKNSVTPEMIISHPDWEENPQQTVGRLYLEMIYGPATHMGCGISAYTEYAYYDNNAPLNYNSIQVICNYSSRPRKDHSVYEVNPPSEVGYTIKCGCPPGTEEDNDCLCYDSPRNAITDPTVARHCSSSGRNCKPAVVLLPIFTIENAPSEKLIGRTNDEKKESEMEIMDFYSSNDTTVIHPAFINDKPNINSVFKNIRNEEPRYKYSTTNRNPILRDVKNRFFSKTPIIPKHSYRPKQASNLGHVKKQSIFSKVPTFELYKKINTTFILDVQPRRDFSNAQSLVKNYMNLRKNRMDGLNRLSKNKVEIKTLKDHNKHLNLNSAEEKVMGYNYYLKNKLKTNSSISKRGRLGDLGSDTSGENSRDNLMHLLDKLEQEVKHIELDENKKEIFDAKIRKIYGTVVGKPVDSMTHRSKYSDKFDTDLTDFEMSDQDKYGSDHPHSDFEYLDHSAKKLHNKIDDIDGFDKNVDTNNHDKYFDISNKLISNNRNLNSFSVADKSDKEHLKSHRKFKHYSNGHHYDEDIKRGLHKEIFSDNDIKFRHILSDKEEKRRGFFTDIEEKRTLKDITEKRKPIDHDNYNDILSTDRRKYYQDKLDNLEKKLLSRYKHHKESTDHLLRPVRPTARDEQPLRPGQNQLDTFYMPDRARFLHGF